MGQFVASIPDQAQTPNVPVDLGKLANLIEKRVVGIYATPAARDTATAGKTVPGMMAITVDTFSLWYYSGSAWVGYPAGSFAVRYGAAAPASTLGNNGDIYYQI